MPRSGLPGDKPLACLGMQRAHERSWSNARRKNWSLQQTLALVWATGWCFWLTGFPPLFVLFLKTRRGSRAGNLLWSLAASCSATSLLGSLDRLPQARRLRDRTSLSAGLEGALEVKSGRWGRCPASELVRCSGRSWGVVPRQKSSEESLSWLG